MASQDQDPFSSPPQLGKRGKLPYTSQSKREISVGLALSGMLIAISFIALLVPLAVYQVAQVAAAVRYRTSVLLLLGVIFSLGLVGFLLGSDLLLFGCVLGIFWTPIISLALYVRGKFQSTSIAVAAFAVPVLFFLACAFLIPHVPDLGVFLDARKTEFLQVLQNSANITDPVLRAKVVANWQQSFLQLRELPEFESMARVAAYSPWQRLAWSVYGGGAAFYFGLLLVALGNLAFLDFAYDQVEKFKVIVAHILGNDSSFPRPLLESLGRLRALKPALASAEKLPLEVAEHKRATDLSVQTKEGMAGFKSRILKAKPVAEISQMWGFDFTLRRIQKGWNFKDFALPLWLGLCAVAAMMVWVIAYADAEGILAAAGSSYGPLIGISSVLAFALLALLAAQGALVLYSRLTGFFLLLFLLVFLLLGSYVSLNPHLIVAVFGSVGLLDDVYDLRGLRARRSFKKVEGP